MSMIRAASRSSRALVAAPKLSLTVPQRNAATEIYLTLKGSNLIGAGAAAGALGGVGTGVGVVFAGLIVGASRQPNLMNRFFQYAIMGSVATMDYRLLRPPLLCPAPTSGFLTILPLRPHYLPTSVSPWLRRLVSSPS